MKFEYLMTADYCADWSPIDAIREIVQNAIDSGKKAEYKLDNELCEVITTNAVLKPEHFALGVSKKASADAIGKYGEGFKIGMLVLARAGLKPRIYSGGKVYKGVFEYNEQLEVDTFSIIVKEDATSTSEHNIEFMCLSPADINELKDKVTVFSDKPLVTDVQDCQVLPDKQGYVYCNGLFVCYDAKLTFGYNVSPKHLELNRDRNMAHGLQWTLGKLIIECKLLTAEELFSLLEADAYDIGDVQYFMHYAEDKLKTKLTRLFYNKYGEDAKIGKPGRAYASGGVSYGSAAYGVMSSCGVSERVQQRDSEAPYAVLEDFVAANRSKLRRDIRNGLERIITKAKGWRKADVL